jgi:CheY-like chemotaxis protein
MANSNMVTFAVRVGVFNVGNRAFQISILRFPLRFTSGATNVRILHVEDDADTRALVALVLQSEGWEVVSVDNASSALTNVVVGGFDLYLIDNWIEGDTGGGLCRRLRAADPHTPILFLSGAVYPADIETALRSGAQGYLEKPCSPDALIEEIVKLTQGRKE